MNLDSDGQFKYIFDKDLFGGTGKIMGKATDSKNNLVDFVAIPYYAWAHREMGNVSMVKFKIIFKLIYEKVYNSKKLFLISFTLLGCIDDISVVNSLDTIETNKHYVSNRPYLSSQVN